MLDRGFLPIQVPYRWEAEAVKIGPNEKFDMMRDLEEFHRSNRLYGGGVSEKAIVNAGRSFGLAVARPGGKERVWIIPPLNEARRQFEASLGGAELFG